jgi:hypothetical protein
MNPFDPLCFDIMAIIRLLFVWIHGAEPTEMDEATIKQRGAIQAQSDTAAAQGAQSPVNAPPAPSGPAGSYYPLPSAKRSCGRRWQRHPASSRATARPRSGRPSA